MTPTLAAAGYSTTASVTRKDQLTRLHGDLLRILRSRGNRALDCYRLQTKALAIILSAETRIRNFRKRIDAERGRLAGGSAARLPKAEARSAKETVRRLYDRVAEAQWLIRTSRTIIDGLVFTVVPKWEVKALSWKESPGFISGKQGLYLERRIFRTIAVKAKRVAILNDLTNCLRYGDVTVDGPRPTYLEVKSGSARSERDQRQRSSGNELNEYLSKDVAVNWHGTGWTVRRVAHRGEDRHHRGILTSVIAEARRSQFSIRRVEPGLYYVALGSADHPEVVLANALKRVRDPFVMFPFSEFVPAYYLPSSLAIADSDAWWDVVAGEVLLIVVIDKRRIVDLLARRGIAAVWESLDRPGVGDGWTVTSPTANYGPMQVSAQFFGRVAGEFLSLGWFVEFIVERFETDPSIPKI